MRLLCGPVLVHTVKEDILQISICRIFSPSSTTVAQSASKAIEFGEITQNKGYYAVQGHSDHRYRSCDFLLVINTTCNWHPILCHFEVIVDYCFKFWTKNGHCVFGLEKLWGLQATYTPFILGSLENSYWTFVARCYGWGAASEYLLEIGVFKGDGSVSAKFSCRRERPHQSFLHG